jgi:hypothetical protein
MGGGFSIDSPKGGPSGSASCVREGVEGWFNESLEGGASRILTPSKVTIHTLVVMGVGLG